MMQVNLFCQIQPKGQIKKDTQFEHCVLSCKPVKIRINIPVPILSFHRKLSKEVKEESHRYTLVQEDMFFV